MIVRWWLMELCDLTDLDMKWMMVDILRAVGFMYYINCEACCFGRELLFVFSWHWRELMKTWLFKNGTVLVPSSMFAWWSPFLFHYLILDIWTLQICTNQKTYIFIIHCRFYPNLFNQFYCCVKLHFTCCNFHRSKAKVWANRCHGPLCRLSTHGDVGTNEEFLCGALWGNGIATVAPETWPKVGGDEEDIQNVYGLSACQWMTCKCIDSFGYDMILTWLGSKSEPLRLVQYMFFILTLHLYSSAIFNFQLFGCVMGM